MSGARVCPGCEETRRLLEWFPSGVATPIGWAPPHRENCPAREPVVCGGVKFWTYAEPIPERDPGGIGEGAL
jgi:hypothetical protein